MSSGKTPGKMPAIPPSVPPGVTPATTGLAQKRGLPPGKLALWMAAFSALGLIVALYLVWIKFSPASLFCSGVGGCEAVNSSVYSWVWGIPVAVFGALAYLTLLALLIMESRSRFFHEWGVYMEFGIALAGTLYSAYLTYLELAVIHQVCPYCVTSAIAMTLICILAGVRLKRSLDE